MEDRDMFLPCRWARRSLARVRTFNGSYELCGRVASGPSATNAISCHRAGIVGLKPLATPPIVSMWHRSGIAIRGSGGQKS